MSDQNPLELSTYQDAFLDAWSTVYVDANIQLKLGIPLSIFLRAPGRYLFFAWLSLPPSAASPDWDSPYSPTDKIILH
jgi:hypothetical protein